MSPSTWPKAEFTLLSFPAFPPHGLHLSTLERPETEATLAFSIVFRPHLTQAVLKNAFAAPLTALGLPSQALCIALFTVASSHLYVLVWDSFLSSPRPRISYSPAIL